MDLVVVEVAKCSKSTFGSNEFDQPWVVERNLKLCPHFEHAVWHILSREEGLIPLHKRLLGVLLTSQAHWDKINREAEPLKQRLNLLNHPARNSRNFTRAQCRTLTTSLMYDRRQYTRVEDEEFRFR